MESCIFLVMVDAENESGVWAAVSGERRNGNNNINYVPPLAAPLSFCLSTMS
jgi:hypothetical protein